MHATYRVHIEDPGVPKSHIQCSVDNITKTYYILEELQTIQFLQPLIVIYSVRIEVDLIFK